MRPLLALLIAALIVGVVQGYMWFQASLPRPELQRVEPAAAAGTFSLEITLTFDAQPDAFEPTSLVVLHAGRELLRRDDRVPAGEGVKIEIAELPVALNEFFVTASAGDEATPAARAVRVRVLRDGAPIAEQTLWSEPGEPVSGKVLVDVPADRREHAHEH